MTFAQGPAHAHDLFVGPSTGHRGRCLATHNHDLVFWSQMCSTLTTASNSNNHSSAVQKTTAPWRQPVSARLAVGATFCIPRMTLRPCGMKSCTILPVPWGNALTWCLMWSFGDCKIVHVVGLENMERGEVALTHFHFTFVFFSKGRRHERPLAQCHGVSSLCRQSQCRRLAGNWNERVRSPSHLSRRIGARQCLVATRQVGRIARELSFGFSLLRHGDYAQAFLGCQFTAVATN